MTAACELKPSRPDTPAERPSPPADGGKRPSRPAPGAGWFWPTLALAVGLSFPYFFSLRTFFSHDDFAILWFHKDWPAWKPWVFLSPDVLTFYRPMQSWTMAVLWQLFGMNPLPYNVLLAAIHVATVVLFGRMVDRLFGDRRLALLSAAFFAANWQYCDVVFWKGNYGTALSWLFAMAAANAFVAYVREGGGRRQAMAAGLCGLALLSKETAVNLPLLLALIYWIGRGRWSLPSGRATASIGGGEPCSSPTGREALWSEARAFAGAFWPFCVLVGAYLAFYKFAVRDAYDWVLKGYDIQSPRAAFEAVFHALTFWLTPFVTASKSVLGSGGDRFADRAATWLDGSHRAQAGTVLRYAFYVLPALLAGATVLTLNRRLAFGLLWSVFAFVPANLIADYHTPRYYYGAIMGVSLVFAELVGAGDRTAARLWSGAALQAARIIGAVAILGLVLPSLAFTTQLVREDARTVDRIRKVHDFLTQQRGRVPNRTLFVLPPGQYLTPDDHFHEGFGLREMFKLALKDDSIEAVFDGQRLSPKASRTLKEFKSPVWLLRDEQGRFQLKMAVRSNEPDRTAIQKSPTSP